MVLSLTSCYIITISIFDNTFFFFLLKLSLMLTTLKTVSQEWLFLHRDWIISSCFGITNFSIDLQRDLWIHLHLDSLFHSLKVISEKFSFCLSLCSVENLAFFFFFGSRKCS